VKRTVVVSDLHLGARSKVPVAGRPAGLARLVDIAAGADRLVLLGDTIELREAPVEEALAGARPVFEAIGEAMAGREVVLIAGNHDHALVAPWLADRRSAGLGPVALDQAVDVSSLQLVQRIAGWLGEARLDVRYPGIWLRDDVYATHGHYLDVHLTVPSFERLAIGANRKVSKRTADPESVEDYEAILTPIYDWLFQRAQGAQEHHNRKGGPSGRAWKLLAGEGSGSPASVALSALIPVAVGALNRAGLGPLRSNITGVELRRAGLRAAGEVCRTLDIRAEHVLFGHTHRTGPLPGDALGEWRTSTGARLHNAGSWVSSRELMPNAKPGSPYWPGGGIVLDGDNEPRVEWLLSGLTADEMEA
jgi:hypothetical protein